MSGAAEFDSTVEPIAFERAICGVDSSPQSLDAARQVREVTAPGGRISAIAVWDPTLARHARIHHSMVLSDLRAEAAAALTRTGEECPDMSLTLLRGSPVSGLLSAAAEENADLIAVGSHGGRRLTGIAFGSVATAMAHHAPCSVLIARSPDADGFPKRIVHANDGSVDSLDAACVAAEIAVRHDSEVLSVNFDDDPDRGRAASEKAAEAIERGGATVAAETRQGSPHRGIVDLAGSEGASLVVLGSRGVGGLKALGSVSERVAHRAPCSVLIVRRPSHPREELEGSAESS